MTVRTIPIAKVVETEKLMDRFGISTGVEDGL
jgi:hypothetical protein